MSILLTNLLGHASDWTNRGLVLYTEEGKTRWFLRVEKLIFEISLTFLLKHNYFSHGASVYVYSGSLCIRRYCEDRMQKKVEIVDMR